MKNYFKSIDSYVLLFLIFLCTQTFVYAATTTGVQVNADGSVLTANNLISKKIDHAHSFTLTAADLPNLDASKITTGTFGTAQIADGAITGAKIAGTTITSAHIQNGTITTTQISGTAGITGSQIASGTVANANLASNIDASKITAGTLPIARIAANAIDNTKIANNTLSDSQIVVGGVGTASLAANAVTNAKINDVAAGKITGTIVSTQIATGAITDAQIHDVAATKITGTIAASQIAAGTITDTQIHDVAASKIIGTITASQIATETITDLEIHDVAAGKITGTIAATQIASLDASKITTGVFGSARIAAGVITSAHLATNSVTNTKIASLAITDAKINDVAASKITGTIATAQIANNAVTNAQIRDVDASKITGTVDASRIAQLSVQNISGLQTQILSIVVSGQELLIDQELIFIRPFTYFEPGSFLRWDNSTGFKIAHWESILPAECTLDLQGDGVLELNADLILKGAGSFKTLGTLSSNEAILNRSENAERTIELSKYTQLFPKCSSKDGLLKSVTLILNSDITLNAKIVVSNRLRIKGNGYSITFNDNAQIIVPGDSFLYLQNVTLKDISSHEELQQNGQLHQMIDGILLQDIDDKKAHLVLENSTLIPTAKRAYFTTGIISLLDNNCRLGGQGKSIDIKQPDSDGNGGALLEFVMSSYSGKSPITSSTDFGTTINVTDDIDLRGSGFLNPTKIDLGNNTMIFDCCSYPSGPSLDVSRTALIPETVCPDSEDDFALQVDTIIATSDVQLPIIGLLHKGDGTVNDPSKVAFGIVNPYTQKFIKGAELTSFNGSVGKSGQILDIAFRRGQPLEISDGLTVYDRYHVALLHSGVAAGSSSLQLCAVDIYQQFYKTDIIDPTQSDNYKKIGSLINENSERLGRMSVKMAGEGVDGLKVFSSAFINFDANDKVVAMAMHPCGKECAVVIEKNVNQIVSYQLYIYQLVDAGKIISEKVIELADGVAKPAYQTKGKPLQWTVDGKFLVLSGLNGDQGVLQTFLRKDTILEKTYDYYVLSPVSFAVHPYNTSYSAVAHDGVDDEQQSGIEILTIDDNGVIKDQPVTFVSMLGSTTFNSLEWNPDGNLLVAATEQGIKLIPYNCNHHVYQPVDNGFYNELDNGQSIRAVKCIANGQQLIKGAHNVSVYALPAKNQGELANGTLDFRHDFACIVPTVITEDLTLNLNKFDLDLPATSKFIINPGVTLTIKNAWIGTLCTQRRALTQNKMINEVAAFVFKDATSTLVLDSSDLNLLYDIDFVAPGRIIIKTKDATVIGSILRVPDEGQTKIISPEGYLFVADAISNSMVFIGSSNNTVDQSKAVGSTNINQQIIRTEATLAVTAVQNFAEGQQQKNSFERSKDGSRTPLTIVGSESPTDPLHYPLKDYMELLGSGPGNVTINGYVQIEGPTTVQDGSKSSLVENTVIKVENGARLIVKTGSVLTCTGQMSLIAGVNGTIIIEDGGLLQFGTPATRFNDQLNLLADGGEIELQGSTSKICFSYGQNKIIMNPRSSIDTTEGGKILINQTAQGVATQSIDGTVSSRLLELTLNKTKIVGSPETNDPVFIIAPNDTLNGVENQTVLNVKNIQCTGNTNTQFMAAGGTFGVSAVLNALDQKKTVDAAQLVERLTLAELPKNNQSVNPARFDAHGDIKAASAVNPLFSYTLYNTDKFYSLCRYIMHTGQEVVSGTDMFGHAFSQFNGSTRINT